MKKLISIVLVLSFAFLLTSPVAFGAVGVKNAGFLIGTATDLNIKGQSSFDGSTLTLYINGAYGGVSQIVSTVSQISAANLAFGLLQLSGASKTFSMAAGLYPGQSITLEKVESDANTLKLDFSIDNPAVAHTGFTSVTWATARGGWVTLTWIDSTVGWIITGASPSGVTIAY